MSDASSEKPLSNAERFLQERQFARRCALQYLYQADMRDDWGNIHRNLVLLKEQVRDVEEDVPQGASFDRAWGYTECLVNGLIAARAHLDELIGASATNWTMARMSMIDRNILRLAAFELYHQSDVPEITALDEGVELAKQFGNADSSRFVNGVLDRLLKEHRRP